MIERHVVFYVGSKVVAAVLNLASVALFTRLAGPAGYGEYLIAFSWAYIVYGWSTQWLQLAFFAHYSQDAAARHVPTLYVMLAGLLALLAIMAAIAAVTGIVAWSMAVKVVSLVLGLSVYDAATQIGKAKLSAGRVSLTIALRGVLVLLAGACALSGFQTALALTLAVGAAHVLAVLPLLPVLLPDAGQAWSKVTATRYTHYGWPLMASFGTASLGQNIDRLLLAHQGGTALVGPYGAIGDLIRQSMVFISEAIAIAYVPMAKDAAGRGDKVAARGFLTLAFRAFAAVSLFGGVFLICFAERLVAIILGPDFSAITGPLIPWLALGAGLAIFRAYYLGQVIYFTGRSGLELMASVATVAVTTGLAFVLIPVQGAVGAAISLAAGQAAACTVFLAGAYGETVMPMPWRDFAGIGAWAAAGYAGTLAVSRMAGETPVSVVLELLCIGLTLFGAARVYNIMNFNDILTELTSLAGNVGVAEPGEAPPAPPSNDAS